MSQPISIQTANSNEPLDQDIFFVSIDINGTPGSLNRFVLEKLGYPNSELPGNKELSKGHHLLKLDTDRSIIFIVTLSNKPTKENLKENLGKAIESYADFFYGKSLWIPLMGTGDGKLTFRESSTIILEILDQFLEKVVEASKITISLPVGIDPGDEDYINLQINIWKSGEEFNDSDVKREVQKTKGETKLPQNTSNYQSVYQEIANASDFYFNDFLSTYETLKSYEGINRKGKNSVYISLKYWFDQLNTTDINKFLEIIKEKEPDLIDALNLIEQVAEDFDHLESTKNPLSKNKYLKTASDQFKLIKEVLDHAIYDFKFGTTVEGSLVNQATQYLYKPIEFFNIFSESHQKLISNYFLGQALTGSTFHAYMKNYFSSYGFKVLRQENETCFYTAIIYDDEVRALWDKPSDGVNEEAVSGTETKSISAKITTAFNDAANQKIDLLGVNREIEVFARLLAQKDINPPLAIALFGNWGSGKSFFMHNLEANIKQLSASNILKADGTPFYCNEIVHISFNAWSYLDANLWAGLVTSIFEKLNEYITQSTKSGVAKMKVVEKLRERLMSFQSLKISEEERKAELEILKKGYEIEQQSLEDSIKTNFSKNIIAIIDGEEELSSIYSSISKDGYLSALTEQLKLEKLQKEAQPFRSFWRNLKSIKSLYKYVLPALLGVGVAMGIWGVSQYLKLGLGALIPFMTTLGIDWKILFSRYQKVKSFVTGFNKIVGQNVDLEEKVAEHKDLVKNADDQIQQAQAQITQLDEKIKDFQKYMEEEINQETIKDFIQTRANHMDYQEKLGIVSIIRRDFETLSELFYESNIKDDHTTINEKDKELLKNQFKKGRTLERIILYIDDLDRCSDDKVLEVLQAVHLLMAFPLFIVVVGVDKRCVTNALYNREVSKYFQLEEYSEIKKGEKTSGIHIIHPDEYLEKIFQIPFQLQRPTSENIQHMIHELLEKDMLEEDHTEKIIDKTSITNIPVPVPGDATDNAPSTEDNLQEQDILTVQPEGKDDDEKEQTLGKPSAPEMKQKVPPEGLKITETEREYIKKISPLIGTTPRTIKRFINIYRLIRAHQDLSGIDEERKYLIVIFILTMHLGSYKKKADALFYAIREHQNLSLDDILKLFTDEESQNVYLTLNDEKLKEMLKVKAIDIQRYISFIRRFSFNALEEQIPFLQMNDTKGKDLK